MEAIKVFEQIRALILDVVCQLTPAQFLATPDKFDNNIAWNIGHILVVQQLLCYRLAGQSMVIKSADVGMFKTGSSPADWQAAPDVDRLLALLKSTTPTLGADYAAGRLARYADYTTSTGVYLPNIDAAIAFNNFHEGLHAGMILSLRNLVS